MTVHWSMVGLPVDAEVRHLSYQALPARHGPNTLYMSLLQLRGHENTTPFYPSADAQGVYLAAGGGAGHLQRKGYWEVYRAVSGCCGRAWGHCAQIDSSQVRFSSDVFHIVHTGLANRLAACTIHNKRLLTLFGMTIWVAPSLIAMRVESMW